MPHLSVTWLDWWKITFVAFFCCLIVLLCVSLVAGASTLGIKWDIGGLKSNISSQLSFFMVFFRIVLRMKTLIFWLWRLELSSGNRGRSSSVDWWSLWIQNNLPRHGDWVLEVNGYFVHVICVSTEELCLVGGNGEVLCGRALSRDFLFDIHILFLPSKFLLIQLFLNRIHLFNQFVGAESPTISKVFDPSSRALSIQVSKIPWISYPSLNDSSDLIALTSRLYHPKCSTCNSTLGPSTVMLFATAFLAVWIMLLGPHAATTILSFFVWFCHDLADNRCHVKPAMCDYNL